MKTKIKQYILISSVEITETACVYLALIIRSTRIHSPVAGLNSRISFLQMQGS